MLFSGIMNAVFFMSMISMLGMAMSPAESGLAGSEGSGTAMIPVNPAGAEDSGASADSGAARTLVAATLAAEILASNLLQFFDYLLVFE